MGRAEDLFKRFESEGLSVLDEMILNREAESYWLDFKRSGGDDGKGGLGKDDRNNLSKAISGFGNTEGGLIVWGVDCRKSKMDPSDIARSKHPIIDAKKFKSWLENAVSGCSIPVHTKVTNQVLLDEDGASGYVVTLIEKCDHAPIRSIFDNIYYIRSGSSFAPVPHSVLAGMFGKAPQPNVFPMFIVEPAMVSSGVVNFRLGIIIHNKGPGIAKDVYVNLVPASIPDDMLRLVYEHADESNWIYSMMFGLHYSAITNNAFRLPPGANAYPTIVSIVLRGETNKDLVLTGSNGAENASPYSFDITVKRETISKVYIRAMEVFAKGAITDSFRAEIAKELAADTTKE